MHDNTYRSPLGYAGQFIGKPALKDKHKPNGSNRTPKALKGKVALPIKDPQNGKTIGCKLFNVGFRVYSSEPHLELVHIDGSVFPPDHSNRFHTLKHGVKAFLGLTAPIEEEGEE